MKPSTELVGTRVTHRRYVGHEQAHYAGNVVDGAFSLKLFGDVATECCILTDDDEGLLASYTDVQFHAAVLGGDTLEVWCEVTGAGNRSRQLAFGAHLVARGAALPGCAGRALALTPPLLVTSAHGVVVVPAREGEILGKDVPPSTHA